MTLSTQLSVHMTAKKVNMKNPLHLDSDIMLNKWVSNSFLKRDVQLMDFFQKHILVKCCETTHKGVLKYTY